MSADNTPGAQTGDGNMVVVTRTGARMVPGEGGGEHRSERTPRCVSEERSRQRTHGSSRHPPWYRATSNVVWSRSR